MIKPIAQKLPSTMCLRCARCRSSPPGLLVLLVGDCVIDLLDLVVPSIAPPFCTINISPIKPTLPAKHSTCAARGKKERQPYATSHKTLLAKAIARRMDVTARGRGKLYPSHTMAWQAHSWHSRGTSCRCPGARFHSLVSFASRVL